MGLTSMVGPREAFAEPRRPRRASESVPHTADGTAAKEGLAEGGPDLVGRGGVGPLLVRVEAAASPLRSANMGVGKLLDAAACPNPIGEGECFLSLSISSLVSPGPGRVGGSSEGIRHVDGGRR